jgi:hypothetical protein
MKFFLILFFSLSILRGLHAQDSTEVELPKGMEYIWRSSDLEGEQPVLRQARKAKPIDGSGALPEGSERVASVCMDYTTQSVTGRGACGGHNGVRFWLYLTPDGDTARIATLRHDDNPDTLSDSKLLELAAYKRYERLMTQKQLDLYQTLKEHPEWLEGFGESKPNITIVAPNAFTQDTQKVALPTMPQNDNPTQASILYGISVLIGSGMLYIINKLRNVDSTPFRESPIVYKDDENLTSSDNNKTNTTNNLPPEGLI